MALTAKQNMFVKEYLVDLNGKQAAIRAGYSEHTAEVQASRLLRNAKVQEAVQEAKNKRASEVSVTAQDVIKDILDTRLCLEQAMAGKPNLKPNDLSTLANARSKTNDMLMKHLGEYRERVEHSGEINIDINWND